jgi:hypothetical protein
MGLIFRQNFHAEFGTRPLASIRHGCIDFGEILSVARTVGDGGDDETQKAIFKPA